MRWRCARPIHSPHPPRSTCSDLASDADHSPHPGVNAALVLARALGRFDRRSLPRRQYCRKYSGRGALWRGNQCLHSRRGKSRREIRIGRAVQSRNESAAEIRHFRERVGVGALVVNPKRLSLADVEIRRLHPPRGVPNDGFVQGRVEDRKKLPDPDVASGRHLHTEARWEISRAAAPRRARRFPRLLSSDAAAWNLAANRAD